MKKFSDILGSLSEQCVEFSGDKLTIGDIVRYDEGTGEVINLGPTYATVIQEGVAKKVWLSSIKDIVGHSDEAGMTKSGSTLSYKGYVTKNFTESTVETFSRIKIDESTCYTAYNFIVALDSLMGMSRASINEDFAKYSNDFNRSTRYAKDFSVDISSILDIAENMLVTEYIKKVKDES